MSFVKHWWWLLLVPAAAFLLLALAAYNQSPLNFVETVTGFVSLLALTAATVATGL